MASISLNNKDLVVAMLSQIRDAISDLKSWNSNINSENDYYTSTEGMKNLAASCMLIEAIGEGFKRIDKLTNSQLLCLRNDIPWQDIIGIRNHIAHGYFDIDGEIVFNTVKNDLDDLAQAVDYFLSIIAGVH